MLEAEAKDEPVHARAEPRVVRGAHPARDLIRQGDELVARHLERGRERERERERERSREYTERDKAKTEDRKDNYGLTLSGTIS